MSLLVCVTVAFSCIRIALFVVYIYMYELHQVETAIVESVELMEEKFTFFWKSLSPFSQWHPAKFTVDGIPAPPPPLINGGGGAGNETKRHCVLQSGTINGRGGAGDETPYTALPCTSQ